MAYRNCRNTFAKAGDFDGLASLRWLDLHGNRLTSLPAGIFRGLASLEWLALGTNGLTSLPAGRFGGRGFDVVLKDGQDAACKPPEAEEPEARSFWRGWRLHLLTSGEDG